ncbi:MAG: TIGR00730 family Rossman fold protein [Planctomycetota bacterium]
MSSNKTLQPNTEDLERRDRVEKIKASPSYVQAHRDTAFLSREELRPVRMQLELMKPELILQELGVHSTIVAFGGTRIIERSDAAERVAQAKARLAEAPDDADRQRDLRIAENLVKKAHYYDEARELGRMVSSRGQVQDGLDYVIVTGGGPGIMEAANRGAHDVGGKSMGLNITIPFEQEPNSYISPELCFEFKYFAIRKMHFLMRAKAMVAFPGGFGTMDELFETLTLIQTQRMDPIPVILFGRDYWERLVNWDMFVEEGTISPKDLKLISYAETAEEVWKQVSDFYQDKPAPKLPRGQ